MHLLEIAARWAWETSVAASVLIGLALVAAGALRKPRFTPIRHLLGLLVVARLLMPFAVPSPFSVFNLIQPQQVVPKPFVEMVQPTTDRPTPQFKASHSTLARTISPHSVTSLFPFLWMVGAIVILGRVTRQHVTVRRWMRAGNRIESGMAAEALNNALGISGCHRNIGLYSVPDLSMPALFGFWRPAILLPRELVQDHDISRLHMVCLHEIAHLRRFDVLINWTMIFAQALHWFNPFVWLAFRRLRADQELLCDNDVMHLLRPEEHRAYGETLLALASSHSFALSTLIPVSSNFKQLKERIGMIKIFTPRTNRFLIFALPPLAAVLAIVTFTGATEKKTPPAAVEEQKKNGKPESFRGDKGMEILAKQVDIETQRIMILEREIDELRKALRISYGDEADLHSRTAETIKKVETDRIRVEEEHEQFASLFKGLKGKKLGELRHVLPTAYRDQALDALLESLAKSEQQLAVLQKDYGPEHAEVVRLTALIKTVNQQIDARIEGVLDGLGALVASKQAIIESLDAKRDEAARADMEGLERARPYFRAKRELETHQRILSSLQTRMIQETVDREFTLR